MIVSLHVATGAALGALARSRVAALALGPPLHLASDRVPHEDIADRRFEIGSGMFGLALLALLRGPLDPATIGAAAACAPDLEHILPRLRPRGRKLFHGRLGWHRSGGLGTNVQLLVAGAIIGTLLGGRYGYSSRNPSRARANSSGRSAIATWPARSRTTSRASGIVRS